MIILGLILIVLALAGALFLFVGTSALDPIQLEVLNQTYSMSPLALVIAGAVAMTLLWWGWALVRIGTRRRVRRSREAKEAARQAELDRAAREKENQAKWERELRERERQVRDTEARLAEQRISTSEARKRAEVAEHKVEAHPGDDPSRGTSSTPTQPVTSRPADAPARPPARPTDGTDRPKP